MLVIRVVKLVINSSKSNKSDNRWRKKNNISNEESDNSTEINLLQLKLEIHLGYLIRKSFILLLTNVLTGFLFSILLHFHSVFTRNLDLLVSNICLWFVDDFNDRYFNKFGKICIHVLLNMQFINLYIVEKLMVQHFIFVQLDNVKSYHNIENTIRKLESIKQCCCYF